MNARQTPELPPLKVRGKANAMNLSDSIKSHSAVDGY
jgi:hypothetical protein